MTNKCNIVSTGENMVSALWQLGDGNRELWVYWVYWVYWAERGNRTYDTRGQKYHFPEISPHAMFSGFTAADHWFLTTGNSRLCRGGGLPRTPMDLMDLMDTA